MLFASFFAIAKGYKPLIERQYTADKERSGPILLDRHRSIANQQGRPPKERSNQRPEEERNGYP